jgi:hypothetical protein
MAVPLPDHAQRVAQRCERDDRRAVLVVVEHRDVELLAQPALDLEAARRRDVLEVDAREDRGDRLDGADDLLGVGGVEADREGVDVGEPLEQRRLALHHRQGRERSDVAQAEHRRAVGDDRDGVALDGEPAGVRRVLGDGHADPRHTRRVDHRQVVARADRHLRLHRQLAPEVQQERAVRHPADLDALHLPHPRDDAVGVLGVVGEHGQVDPDPAGPGRRDVQAGDHSPGRLDDARHLAHRRRTRRQDEADGDGVGDRRGGRHTEDSTRYPQVGGNRRPRAPGRPYSDAHVRPRGSPR